MRAGWEPGRSAGRLTGMRWLSWVAILVLVSGCGATTDLGRQQTQSGVRGTTTVGPTCPVEQAGHPCPDRPIRVHVSVRTLGSDLPVAQTSSGRSGRFSVNLPPGRYVLDAVVSGQLPRHQELHRRVAVLPHTFTRVTLTFDSGIR
ncbi:MAG: hypothetical protein ACRDPG_10500 [Nocardioidaceae bacterium]